MPAGALAGTVNRPVTGSKVEPAVAGVTTLIVVLVALAGFAPLVSLVSTLTEPALPNGVLTLSFNASITATVAEVALLALLPSLVAPVLPFTPTLVCVVSVPPAVPGIVTVIGQMMVPPAARLATGSAGVQLPTLTVAPAGVPAAAVHVGLVAAVVVATLLHVKVPVNTAPGPAVPGKPVIDTLMSDEATVTVTIAVSQTEPFGAGRHSV